MYCPGFLIEGKVNKKENDLKSKREIERERDGGRKREYWIHSRGNKRRK